jgi:hypothetical protein
VNAGRDPIEVTVDPGSNEYVWYFKISGVRNRQVKIVSDGNWFRKKLEYGIAYSYDRLNWTNVDNGDDNAQVIVFGQDSAYVSTQPIITNTSLTQWYDQLPDKTFIEEIELCNTDAKTGYDPSIPTRQKNPKNKYDRGFPLRLFKITDSHFSDFGKNKFFLMARECVWETQSTIACMALIEWLLSNDPLANGARRHAVWYAIPIANVDNVSCGKEASLKWTWFKTYNPDYVSPFEEVEAIKDFIENKLNRGHDLDFASR